MTATTIAAVRETDRVDESLVSAFGAIVGNDNVLASFDQRLGYARDRLPFAVFRERAGTLAGAVPRLVVRPANEDEIIRVVQLARARNTPIIPYGNGSGVLGGAIPLGGEMMLDTRRLDKIVSINPTDAVVTVQAGMNGAEFERQLNEAGYTCGHLPQSIEISTVGGSLKRLPRLWLGSQP